MMKNLSAAFFIWMIGLLFAGCIKIDIKILDTPDGVREQKPKRVPVLTPTSGITLNTIPVDLPTKPAPKTIEVVRSLWIRNQDVILDQDKHDNLFAFASDKGITTFAIDAYSLLREEPTALRDFIIQAGQHNFDIEFVVGEPEWARDENHFLPHSFLQDTIAFSKNLLPEQKPIGVQFDIRPYLLGENWPMGEYLKLLDELSQSSQGTDILVTAAIPFWYDIEELQFDYKGQSLLLSDHIAEIVDRVFILNFRDFADGADGLVENVATEMAYSAALGKPVIIGVETDCDQLDPPKVTFCEEGEVILDRELEKLEEVYGDSPSWGGISIHNYTAYRELIAFPCSEDGIFSIADPRDGYRTTERFITVYGCGGVTEQPVQVYVDLDDGPHLQDAIAMPESDGRWQTERVVLGGEPLPAEHRIYAVTKNTDGTDLRTDMVVITKTSILTIPLPP